MKIPESPPENTAHSNNGHSSISTQTTTNDAKKPIGTQCENGFKISSAVPAKMDFNKFTTRELLDYFLRTNDQDAWNEFWRRVRPVIRGRCASKIKRYEDDLLNDFEHEVFMKLWANNQERLRDFTWEDDNSIFRYLRVVSASVVIDYFRKTGREIFLDPEDLRLVMDKHAAGLPTAELECLRAEIDKCLRSFASEKERQIFTLFYRRGFTARQIANLPTINLPVRKVENILQGLVRKVKKKLGESGKSESPD